VDARERRLTENELLFREVNERIDDVGSQLGGQDTTYEFLCECSDPECVERVSLTIAQYRRLRSRPVLFVLVKGHEITAIERVVEEIAPGIVAVEKTGEAGDLVNDRVRRPR
jgi:hypothetical protein